MKRHFLIFAVVVVLTSHIQVLAIPTLYFSRASYEADIASDLFFIDFDGGSNSPTLTDGSLFSSDVTFSAILDSPGEVYWNNDSISALSSSIEATFTDMAYTFAFEYSSLSMLHYVAWYGVDDNLLGETNTSFPTSFFGLHSDVPIGRIEMLNLTQDTLYVHNFRSNTSTLAIPAPGALTLSGIGISFVALLRRKKTSVFFKL